MSSVTKKNSRLDPEPIPRRDFLGMAALWSTASALLLVLLGIGRLPRAAVLPSPSKKFRVTLPASLPLGAAYIPPGRSVAIVRDNAGVFAVSTICTHLGCIVKQAEDGFHCPCHGSAFAPDGSVLKGPAPKSLPWLEVTAAGDGVYVIDEGSTVPSGTRVLA